MARLPQFRSGILGPNPFPLDHPLHLRWEEQSSEAIEEHLHLVATTHLAQGDPVPALLRYMLGSFDIRAKALLAVAVLLDEHVPFYEEKLIEIAAEAATIIDDANAPRDTVSV